MAGWQSYPQDLDPSFFEAYNLGVCLQVVGLSMSLPPRLPDSSPSRSQIYRKVTTIHIGHEVIFDEERNIWFAPSVLAESASLSHLRFLIETHARRTRDLNILAFLLDNNGFSIVPVVVVRLDHDRKNAWILDRIHSRNIDHEEKVDTRRLIEDNSRNRQLLLAWRDASIVLMEHVNLLQTLRDRIPRMGDGDV